MESAPDRPRYFTIAEVNALLPFLSRSLEELQALLTEARAKRREMDLIKAVGYREDGSLIMEYDYKAARRDLDRTVQEANRRIDDIHALGCQIKSIELGLVDFPARINGCDVLLCWRLGEEQVGYYHLWDTGYADRRPIQPGDDDTPYP